MNDNQDGGPPPAASGHRKYYAVRVGHDAQQSTATPVRSAVFLHWEDVHPFVSSDRGAEWAEFDTFREAEAYLLEGHPSRVNDFLAAELRQASSTTAGAGAAAAAGAESNPEPSSLGGLADWNAISADTKKSSSRKRSAGRKKRARMEVEPSYESGEDSDSGECTRAVGKKGPSKSDIKWDEKYNDVLQYRQPDGSIDIPKSDDGEVNADVEKLRRWYKWHMSQARKHPDKVSPDRLEKLQNIGLQLSPSWDSMYEKLAARKAETGNGDVKKADDAELYDWIVVQKKELVKHYQGKDVSLSNERVNKLKALGYAPTRKGTVRSTGIKDAVSLDAKWNDMFEELRAYKERNGHMKFYHKRSDLSPRDKKLMYWVMEQRKEWKQMKKGEPSTLSAMRLQRMTDLGFNFQPNPDQVSWEQRLESLRAFVAEHGHCKVPVHSALGTWVSAIRGKYRDRLAGKKTSLTDERVNELTELGFVFHAGKTPKKVAKKSWDDRFKELVAFKEEHGHTMVPQLSGPLGNWVRMQRLAYKRLQKGETGRKSLTTEKALRLSEIGMVWDASERWKAGAAKDKDKDKEKEDDQSVPDEIQEEI